MENALVLLTHPLWEWVRENLCNTGATLIPGVHGDAVYLARVKEFNITSHL